MLKRNFAHLILAVSLITAITAGAHAQNTKAQITQNLKKMETAFKKGDINAYMSFYSPKYTATLPGGMKQDYNTVKTGLTQITQMAKTTTFTQKLVKFSEKNNKAITVVQTRYIGTAKNPQTNKTNKLDIQSTDEYTWSKSGNKWVIVSEKQMKHKMLIDGKEIKMP